MTRHAKEFVEEYPRMAKVLIGAMSILLVVLTVVQGWQIHFYNAQRAEVTVALQKQDLTIEKQNQLLADLRLMQQAEALRNQELHMKLPEKFISIEQYRCDISELKETMRLGFLELVRKLELHHGSAIGQQERRR